MRGLAKLLLGLGLPLLLVVGYVQLVGRPADEVPDAPSVEAGATGHDLPPDGNWELVAADSFVGYRIVERDPTRQRPNEAVGRTSAMDGHATVANGEAVDARVEVDLRELDSGRQRRDQAIRQRYLESFDYPTGRFTLSEPFPVADALADDPQGRTVAGDLQLRDQTVAVEADVDVGWDGEQVELAGTVPVTLADFGIEPPRIPGFRFVADDGDVELHLTFVPGGEPR